ITCDHNKLDKKSNQADALVPLADGLKIYNIAAEDKKEASLGQHELQLVETSSKTLSAQSVYLEALAPTIKEEQSSVLSQQKAVVPYSDSGRLIENIRQRARETLPLSHSEGSIKPSKALNSRRKQAEKAKKEYQAPTSSLAVVDKQALDKQFSVILLAKGGHQVYFDNSNAKEARIVANVPSTAGKYPILQLPLTYKSSSIDLLHLSKQPTSYQQNRVRVCFPSIDKEGVGYVSVEDYGLKGGAMGIRIDVEGLINTIVSGYGLMGMRPSAEIVNSWRPFLNEFANTLANMDIDLEGIRPPRSVSHYDPGNMRSTFENIVRDASGRNVRLENYGTAYAHIVNQIREKIRQRQSMGIDPSEYPTNSYEVTLQPNLFNMISLASEINRVYAVSSGSSVAFDLARVLNIVNVVVTFNNSFSEFERNRRTQKEEQEQQEAHSERERQAREQDARRDQVRRIVDRVVGEVESIESDFINLKSHLQGLNLSDPSSNEDVKKVIVALKQQHEVLMRKFSVLDDLAGADEETRAKRKFLVSKVSAMLDEIDRFLRESHEALEKQQSDKKLLVNPTGKGIRNDSGGLGHFGAPRGVRKHMGIDFQSVYGQDVVSPVTGKAINSSFKNKKNIEIPTVVIVPTSQDIGFNKLELLYVGPIRGGWRSINKGDVVGQSISLQTLGYTADVGPHIHLQMKLNGEWVNPTPYFPGLT
ncbi:MAG: M23 family metallopeptidase, partial [Candidatus Amoebophilus sp.]